MTALAEWCRTAWLVEPRSRPVKPPRPREPTTMRSVAVENSVSSAAPVPSRAWRLTCTPGRSINARSTTTLSPSATSARTASWSIAAGSHASAPAPEPNGTPATAVSSAPQAFASRMACRSARSEAGEPSTPTTMRRTGAIGCWSTSFACTGGRVGTTTVGQNACAGSADETVPSSRSANPPPPRVPRTTRRAVRDRSTSTPVASPVARHETAGTPSASARAWASASTTLAPTWIAVSSSAA